jgi:ubiquinone/menaquinone biosynthesis C-methylase UbiE
MPTVQENLALWGERYDWSHAGDGWSLAWGGTEQLWGGTLLPRLQPFLPASTILEIAPGYGRCTAYLKDLAERLLLVDLNENCIEACMRRFSDASNIEYHVNDGRSLEMVPDGTIDLVFSWDSLVHVDAASVSAYVEQLARKLTPDGVVFLHHSNAGQHLGLLSRLLPQRAYLPLERRLNRNWRDPVMSARSFREVCGRSGLVPIVQELIEWRPPRWLLTDCISVATLPGSRHEQPLAVRYNPRFMAEARRLRKTSELYGSP